jgi:D-threo-aldose 1-dehydrogenase
MAFGRLAPLTPAPTFRESVGLGCAPIGDLYTSVAEGDAEATVIAALRAGIAFFDTAPRYGRGLSELRLGRALRGVPRDSVSIATKVGWRILDDAGRDAAPDGVGECVVLDLSADGILRSLESSLDRLAVDRVDVLYLHDIDDVDVAMREAVPTMHRLRADGVVRAIGAGMNVTAPLARYAAECDFDVVMEAGRYTLLDGSAEHDLFPVSRKHDVAVVAAGVFNSGILASPDEGARFDYRAAPADLLARARRLDDVCRAHGTTIGAAAARFPLRHPAVDAIVVGARTPAEVSAFVAQLDRPIPDALWEALDD